jgi:hypothetical protein
MGAGHSVAYLTGAVALGVGLARRTAQPLAPARLPRAVALSGALGCASAAVLHWVDPTTRTATVGLAAALMVVCAGVYLTAMRPTGPTDPASAEPEALRPAMAAVPSGDTPGPAGEARRCPLR